MKQNTNQIFKAEDLDWKELEKNGKNGKNGKNVSDLKSKKEEYGGKKTPDQIMEYINEYLPEDIAVLSCEAVPERFHSRLSAVKKTYCYQLEMGAKKDVFQRNYYYGLGNPIPERKPPNSWNTVSSTIPL